MNPASNSVDALSDLKELRILHLEDDANDRELVKDALAEAGIAGEFISAADREEFLAAIEQGNFDVILADFSLPGFDGATALAIAQQKFPVVPFIFVSGTIGEERAVDILRSGATDCILKGRLDRLAPAVRRALREARDRAKRLEAEESLRCSEERFREMAENISDIFWNRTPDGGRLLYVSPAVVKILGRSVAELYADASLWTEAIAAADRAAVLAAFARLQKGRIFRIEYQIRQPSGTMIWLEDRGYAVRNDAGEVVRTVGVATDITQRKNLEGELRHALKIEAVGQLAGGVAHDFNNLLTVINGHAELLLDSANLAPQANESLKQIYAAGERATSLTRQLLLFSRKQRMCVQTLNLNDIIKEMVKLLGRLIGEHITLELNLAAQQPIVQADPGMIEQIVMNLAVNARDAMPQSGRLSIKTESVTITDAEAEHGVEMRAGEFIRLEMRDSGSGIAPEILPRIFEPFFTTKEAGHGTGLGLATVFGIVKQHHGWLTVDSTVGVGTTFRVYLPAAPTGAVATVTNGMQAKAEGGGETILLVEDETIVREFACAVLKQYGYRVLQATSGVEALEVWKWHGSRIDLLVTDMVMPDDMTGLQLAEKLRMEKPGLRVICTSGYSPEIVGQFPAPAQAFEFLQKPYSPRALTVVVRETLNQLPV